MGKPPTVDGVGSPNEIRQFLMSRRARISPEQAGLGAYGGRRRVSGLRREEVALLAGISVEYYIQLERGKVRGVSEDVLAAVARALQLDDVERRHLFDLVRAAKLQPRRRSEAPQRVRPGVQRILDAITEGAAAVPPSPGRGPPPRLRSAHAYGRHRADTRRLPRRTRLAVPRGPQPP